MISLSSKRNSRVIPCRSAAIRRVIAGDRHPIQVRLSKHLFGHVRTELHVGKNLLRLDFVASSSAVGDAHFCLVVFSMYP